MYKTIKDFNKLQFPLYTIPSENWDIIDGLVFVDNQIVDDLNKRGHSIGVRRKQSNRPKMLKLKNPLFYVSDVIKTKKNHFISSAGKPFTYVKTGFQRLKYYGISNFEPRDTYTNVWLRGITIPFQIPRPPADQNFVSWARVLHYNGYPWMIYDFSYVKGKPSRIKV